MKNGLDVSARSINFLFVTCLFVACLIISNIIPPFQSPDENSHLVRSYLLSKGSFMLSRPIDQPESKVKNDSDHFGNGGRTVLDSPRTETSSGGIIDKSLDSYIRWYSPMWGEPTKKVSQDIYNHTNMILWSHDTVWGETPGTGYCIPLIYAPHAIAFWLGEKLSLTVDQTYRLVRNTVLVVSFSIIIFSIIIHNHSPFLLALLTIPMTLFQLSSPTIDGITTALLILSISSFTRIYNNSKNDPLNHNLLILMSMSILLVVGSRIHMLPIALLIFLTYLHTKDKRCLLFGFLTIVIILSWIALAILNTHDARVNLGLTTTQIIQYYAENLAVFFYIVYDTLTNSFLQNYWAESFFGKLGWLDTTFSPIGYQIIYVLSGLIFIFSLPIYGLRESWKPRLALFVCSILSILMICIALLVTWTPHPAKLIDGIQGRYFIGPAILLAFSLEPAPHTKSLFHQLLPVILLFLFFFYSASETTTTLINRYYLQ